MLLCEFLKDKKDIKGLSVKNDINGKAGHIIELGKNTITIKWNGEEEPSELPLSSRVAKALRVLNAKKRMTFKQFLGAQDAV